MGFIFSEGAFTGFTGTIVNVDCTGSPGMTVHFGLGGGYSRANGSSPQTKRCPITKQLGPDTLRKCANACKDSTPPEGFNVEIWGGSDAIFSGNTPVGLNKGDTLFFWREGATQSDIPEGFEGDYLKDGILVVSPPSVTDKVELLNTEAQLQPVQPASSQLTAPDAGAPQEQLDTVVIGS